LVDLVFDAQTSGGLILSVPPDKVDRAVAMLLEREALAVCVGEVKPMDPEYSRLTIVPESSSC
jgi:selenide,water dikinase